MIPRLEQNLYRAQLMSLQQLAGALLRHVAKAQPGPRLVRATLLAELPAVEPLLDRLEARIDTLLASTDPAQRAELAEAFANDVGFDGQHDAAGFRFRYPGLPSAVRAVAGPLLTAFYKDVLAPGVTVTGPDGAELRLDRHLTERGFFAANAGIRACPACLENKLVVVRTASTTSCDHFLPHSIYAPLSVHPANLLFMCPLCNERLKGRKDPLTGARAASATAARVAAGALRRSYLPFLRPAEGELQLRFSRRAGAAGSVRLTAATPEARMRVENLDRVFDLTGVWTDALPMAEREFYEQLETPLTRDAVTAMLDRTVRSGRGPVVQLKDGAFVRSQYADYLRTTDLGTLMEEWTERIEETERSRRLYAADSDAVTTAGPAAPGADGGAVPAPAVAATAPRRRTAPPAPRAESDRPGPRR